jgi:hypothetical protein
MGVLLEVTTGSDYWQRAGKLPMTRAKSDTLYLAVVGRRDVSEALSVMNFARRIAFVRSLAFQLAIARW